MGVNWNNLAQDSDLTGPIRTRKCVFLLLQIVGISGVSDVLLLPQGGLFSVESFAPMYRYFVFQKYWKRSQR
jgi:hypothetical protein